jgi:hypothetical protein
MSKPFVNKDKMKLAIIPETLNVFLASIDGC